MEYEGIFCYKYLRYLHNTITTAFIILFVHLSVITKVILFGYAIYSLPEVHW